LTLYLLGGQRYHLAIANIKQ